MKRLSAALLVLLSGACASPVVVAPPADELRSARTAATLAEIRRTGRDGDWLVIRGYHGTDNLVTVATNTPWSHAAVLDASAGQVIEADSRGVHVSPLAEFVARSHRLLLVRPVWADDKTSGEAVLRARTFVGKGYDFLGLVGIDNPERFYCSELAVAAYRPHIPPAERIPRPVAPGQLHYWGRILYDTGNP